MAALGRWQQIEIDSKNIYIACNHHIGKIQWIKEDDNEWSWVGVDDEFQDQKVLRIAKSLFGDSEIYFVINRHDSHLTDLNSGIDEVREKLKDDRIILSDKSFQTMMQFGQIGVMRRGKSAANTS